MCVVLVHTMITMLVQTVLPFHTYNLLQVAFSWHSISIQQRISKPALSKLHLVIHENVVAISCMIEPHIIERETISISVCLGLVWKNTLREGCCFFASYGTICR